jgi:hypothetical protein
MRGKEGSVMKRWSGVRQAAVLIYCSEPVAGGEVVQIKPGPKPLDVRENSVCGHERRSVFRRRSSAGNAAPEHGKSPAGDGVFAACELLVVVVTICLLALMFVLHS